MWHSDHIYGTEPTGRYVCQSRLYKMLDHEYDLISSRLTHERPGTNFFVFADTVAAINYSRTIKGDGWLGLRFQLKPDQEPNELILHVGMLDNDNQLQQQAIGVLGVNLSYACFNYYEQPQEMLKSLLDGLEGTSLPTESYFVDFLRDIPEPSGEEPDNVEMEAPKVYEQVSGSWDSCDVACDYLM